MLPLLEGTDGIQKMSKSFGNYIGINESSSDITIMVNSGLAKSRNEARRLVKQEAVFFDNVRINQIDFEPKEAGVLRVGSKKFLKMII